MSQPVDHSVVGGELADNLVKMPGEATLVPSMDCVGAKVSDLENPGIRSWREQRNLGEIVELAPAGALAPHLDCQSLNALPEL